MTDKLLDVIERQKHALNAVILAHYYQVPEIQDVADIVGDSLHLARQAAQTDAEVIILCGVKFMAESAKILCPDKIVLLPEISAGCPMADMITAEQLRAMKQRHPGAAVVCYVNSSAEVKAESDLCCTSSNAVAVVKSIPAGRPVIFVPDKNLGAYTAAQTGRDLILWDGYCPIHNVLSKEELEQEIRHHPGARVVVHPECPPEITAMADAVCSTGGILEYVKNSSDREFIIGTEEGFLHTLKKNCPDKSLYLARKGFRCEDMKYITLEKLALAMESMRYQIDVPDETREKAVGALERMLSIAP